MAFTPTKSPLYGGGPLTIRFENDHEFNQSLPFFVIFEGSRRRHVVSTHYNESSGLFTAHIPGHEHAEEVQVTLVQLCNESDEGLGTYSPLTHSYLNYEVDTTVHLAKFLTSSVYNDHALDNLELIKSDHFDLSNEVLSTLDVRLNLALRNSDLSPSWHLLGGDSLSDVVCEERETLLHFCARLGLIQVAHFLLEQPGAEDALRLSNRHGELPYSIAHQNGFHELADMLTGYNTQVQGHIPHHEVVDIDHGVVRILDDGNASITSFLDNPNMDRSIENEIDFLRETEEMMKMQRGISHHQNYNSDWPGEEQKHLTGASRPFPSTALEQEMEESMQRLLKNQQLHGQTLQGLLSYSQNNKNNNIEVRRLDDDNSKEHYPVLEKSLSRVHDLSESLFQFRERYHKSKMLSQALRKKHLTRFSSSCPSLIQPVLSSVPENGEQPSEHNNNGVSELNESHLSDGNFDPRVHIRINGVTVDSSETRCHAEKNLPSVVAEDHKKWDGSAQIKSYNSTSVVASPHPKGVEEEMQGVGISRKSLSLTNLDEEDDEDEDEEFPVRLNSQKQRSLEETTGTKEPILSNLILASDPFGDSDSISPGSSPQSKEMIAGRGLSPYNAKSLQDLATPDSDKDLVVMSTSPTKHYMFEDSGNMTKSLSTPSIPYAVEFSGDHVRGRREGKHQGEKMYPNYLEDYDLFKRQKEIEEIDEEDMSTDRKKCEISWKDFLSEEHSPNDSDEKSSKTGRKEEKRRKPSMFSRFQSSYRTKKTKGKEGKNKDGHNFVAVSFSNSTSCDVCHKSVANKSALRCQTCLVNVHESGCKDQVICERRSILKALPRDNLSYSGHSQTQSQVAWLDQQPPSLAPVAGSHVRATNPIKERRTYSAIYPQVPPPLHLTHRYSLPTASKAISEEIECDTASTLESSNIAETISESLESLDADGLVEMQTLEGEPELQLLAEEPEAWSITVDKRTLKKLSTKDIKRQDTIWELIQTEKQYVKRLRIMQKIFAQTMILDLNYPQEQVDRLFPRLDELVDLHCGFLQELQILQSKNEDRYVEEIGLVLVSQFSDATADKMKSVYGVFCSKHTEAMQLYKEFIKVDRKFQNFAKKCTNLAVCEKRDISDFILGVTVRLSKYPILLEAILKSTKDKKDRENLSHALHFSKDVVQHVDERVAAYEKLVDIQSKLESRAVMYQGKKFKRQDLTSDGRELVHVGKLGLKTARGRVYDVLVVVLTDIIVLLQKSEQKFAFLIQDNKSCIIPLYRLLVREKNDEKDSLGIYMISQKSSTPEMYEFMCQSKVERENWIHLLQDAIRSCPPEKETERVVNQTNVSSEEDRKKEEQTANQIKEIIEQLHHQDSRIKECCDNKNRLIQKLMGVQSSDIESRTLTVQDVTSDHESMEIMQAAMQEASRLTTILHGSESQLSRSVSSVGEHVSDSYVATVMPRRAETFSGFDSSYESQSSEISAIKPQQFIMPAAVHDDDRGTTADLSMDEGTSSFSDTSFSTKDSSRTAEPQPVRRSPSPPKHVSGALLRQSHISLDNSSQLGSLSELSMSSFMPSTASTEHMTSITHLVQYLNALMSITCRQNTKVESLQAELEEAKRQIAKLSADMHGRRSVYGHDQLEELRNLQENINRERQEWERTKSQDNALLQIEKEKFEAEKMTLEKEKRDLHNKREDLKREKEALQRQIDMMRAQGYHISSNVVEQKSDAPDQGNLSKSEGHKQVSRHDSMKQISHQRSASADLSFTAAKDAESMHHRQASEHQVGGAGHLRHARLSVGNLAQAKQILPVHLLSARNEQRIGGANVQHLPLKLAGSNSVASSNPSQQQQIFAKISQSSIPGIQQASRAGSTAGSTDIKRVQSMSASPRSASGQTRSTGSRSFASAPSDMSGLMKLADPKARSSSISGSGAPSNKGSSSNSGSATKSKSVGGQKGGSSDGVYFF